MYFYELHEGDNEIYSDLLLVHDDEFEPNEFLDLVQEIRERIRDQFVEDTLSEAIAAELERLHGFTFVGDHRLSASVHVSPDEEETYLTDIDRRAEFARDLDSDEDDDEDDGSNRPDYRGIFVELEPDRGTGLN